MPTKRVNVTGGIFAQARSMWLLGLQFIVSDDHLK